MEQRLRLTSLNTDSIEYRRLCSDLILLADRTNGRAIGTVLRLSVCRL